jgi:hypothetical protein
MAGLGILRRLGACLTHHPAGNTDGDVALRRNPDLVPLPPAPAEPDTAKRQAALGAA